MTRKGALAVLAALVLLLVAGLVWPLAVLAVSAVKDGVDWQAVLSAYNLRAVRNTVLMGAAVAAAACVLGFVVSFALVLTRAKGKALMRLLFLAPLFAPSIMPAIGLIYLAGNNGILINTDLYGAKGVFFGALVFTLPHAVMQLSLNLSGFDEKLIYAARSLGAGAVRRFLTVLLPHCRPGLANAFLIAFVLTITDFGVPKMLGGNFPMLSTEIYNLAIGSQDFSSATVLSAGLLIPAAAAFWAASKLAAGKTFSKTGLVEVRPDPVRDALAGAAAWLVVIAQTAVIAVVIYGSFVTFWPYQTELTAANYAFRNSTYGIAPWVNSLVIASAVAVAGTFAAWFGAYCLVRVKAVPGVLKSVYRALAAVPMCIPGTVLGLAWAMSLAPLPVFAGAAGALCLVIFNTLTHLYTVPHLTAAGGLAALESRFEVVGESLGAPQCMTLRRVVWPLSRPMLAEMFSYLFASAVTTISAVVFIYTPSSIVASVAAVDMIDSGFVSEGAAMATLIFASALIVRLVALAWGRAATKRRTI